MIGSEFSVILLPTLQCNVACDYCFINRSAGTLSLDSLAVLARKVRDFMDTEHVDSLTIHWQGGEIMTLGPEYFWRARDVFESQAGGQDRQIRHSLQSNMIAYDDSWNSLIHGMFGGSVGSSIDYPNLHRRMAGGDLIEYDRIWAKNIRAAREAGISVGVICIPNRQTLEIGAERFYRHVVEDLGLTDFQVNTPFAGGAPNAVKSDYPLDPPGLGRFLVELAEVWLRDGLDRGVRVGPFSELVDYFNGQSGTLPCFWHRNCAQGFMCIDPRGNVSQCDCWVASYPEYRFGNVFEARTLSEILRDSPVRRQFRDRPGGLVSQGDCIDCEHLALCHGGCPIRAYTSQGTLLAKDPYCETYRAVFDQLPRLADRAAACRQQHPPKVAEQSNER